MNPYEVVKSRISETVPYAQHTGIELLSVSDGQGEALLPEQKETLNHIATQHAGALFTLGEAASGAAMAGGFLPVLLSVRPVAANATIQYLALAKGPIHAFAKISDTPKSLLKVLSDTGKVQFKVNISMRDEAEAEVATMQVDWHVSKAREN